MEIEPVNIDGFEALAREALSQPAFDYISGSAGYAFELAMALVGCRSVADMCRSHLLMPAQ